MICYSALAISSHPAVWVFHLWVPSTDAVSERSEFLRARLSPARAEQASPLWANHICGNSLSILEKWGKSMSCKMSSGLRRKHSIICVLQPSLGLSCCLEICQSTIIRLIKKEEFGYSGSKSQCMLTWDSFKTLCRSILRWLLTVWFCNVWQSCVVQARIHPAICGSLVYYWDVKDSLSKQN